jgi:Rrf2 family protein
MLDLSIAHQGGKGQVFLKDIAGQEGISEKYLSLIMIPLKAAGLVTSTRGAHGGYTLARHPSEITLREIVDVLEGGTCLVDCVKSPDVCPRSGICASRDLWSALSGKISETLGSITLDDLAGKSREKGEASGMYHI